MEKLDAHTRAMSLVDRAEYVARRAHEGQVRKYTGEPYIVHPKEVARLVEERYTNQYLTAAAWLHDVIEDTDVTEADLRTYFPPCIVDIVVGLTDVYTSEAYPHANRATRKAAEVQRYAMEDANVQRVKLCDLMDNTRSIIHHDPKFAIVYLKEKAELLAVFREEVME